jgi:GNAT superfamily N-acetyltransferase
VTIRLATTADEQALRELWDEFAAEVPPPPEDAETWEQEWTDIAADIGGSGAVHLAEDEKGVAGVVRASMRPGGVWYVALAHVRPRARRHGLLKELLRASVTEARERGATRVTLDVLASNEDALAVWRRLGFEPAAHYLGADLTRLQERVARAPAQTRGEVFVQSDDLTAIERAVARYVPRLGHSERTHVAPPEQGWIRIEDELCSREPSLLRRLARELSDRTGAVVVALALEDGAVVRYVLFDRGRVADEYASVPEYQGPLPPGDVVGLASNPTVVQRLTGADPERVRRVARTAASPDELPPAEELHAQIAEALGLPR